MRINLIHLSSLDAIVRLGTLAAAAAELGYTPGALSQQMEALSRTVGAPVLTRVGRLVELTDVGRVVAAEGRRLLEAEQRLLHSIPGLDDEVNDEVVLGSWGSTAAAILAPVIETSRTTHPGLHLRSREVDVDEAAEAVARRRVDVAFGLTYSDSPIKRLPDVDLINLRTERFSIAVPLDDPRAGSTKRLADFSRDQWVLPSALTVYGQAMRIACRRVDFEPLVWHEVTDTAATLTLAGLGLGVAPATELMLALSPVRGVGQILLHDDVRRELVLIAPSSVPRRHSVAALIELVRSVVGDL